MKKILLPLLFGLLLAHVSFGQKDEAVNKLTPDELKAVQEISEIFPQRLNETDDVNTIFNDLFINDFVERYIKEHKRILDQNQSGIHYDLQRFPFVLFIYINSAVLNKATPDDWKRFYISIFNYGHFEWISILSNCRFKIAEEKKNVPRESINSKYRAFL